MRIAVLLLAAALALAGAAATLTAEPGTEPWLRAAAYVDHAALARGQAFRAAVVLDLAAGYHVNANPPSLDFQIPTKVTPAPREGILWGEVRYPEGKTFEADWAGDQTVRVYSGRTVLVAPGTVADDAPLGLTTLRLTLTYQGCDASTCYQPGERTVEVETATVAADAAPAPANAEIFDAAQQPVPPEGDAAASAVRFEGEEDVGDWFRQGFLVALPLLFLGGLALNLTPCVFPLIPVTMNFFAAQGESRPTKVLPLAILYVVGLAVTFSVVGVLAALAGQSLGLVLQTPWGVLGVVVVLAVMMASSFGAFDIHLPSGAMGKLGTRRGLLGAAFMGMVMGAIAAPCVGPFLISLITAVAAFAAEHSMAKAVPLGAGAFFTVGLGLGLPYVFLGGFTSLINRFPRGGGWLVWTKRLLGLGLAGLILHLLRPYIASAMFWPLVLGLCLFAGVYVGFVEGLSRRPFSKTFWTVRIVAAVALLAGGVAFYATRAPEAPAATPETGGARTAAEQAGHIAWTEWRPGALAEAREAGRGVLLYFGADWCAECRVWKSRLFSRAEVAEAARQMARLYVDVTENPTGEKRELAERYRGRNPPAVILLGAGGEVVKAWRDPPDAETFVEALKQAAGPRE